MVNLAFLFHPVGDEYIGIARAAIVAVRAENEFLAIVTKHRESIKAFVAADLLQMTTIGIHRI